MSLKRLVGETAVYGISSILGRLLNFILLTPLVTRVLTEEEYGVVSDLFFYTAFFIAFLVFRLDTTVFRFANDPKYSVRAVSRTAQRFVWVLVLIVCGGGLLLAPTVAGWMAYPDRVIYIQLFLLIVAFDALAAIPLARLRLEQRAWMFAGVNLINIFVNLVLVYLLLRFIPLWKTQGSTAFDWHEQGHLITYFFLATLVASIIRYVLLILDRLRQSAKSPGREEILEAGVSPSSGSQAVTAQGPGIMTMLTYAAPLVIVALAGIVNTLVGPTMIKSFYGEDLSGNLYWSGQYGAAMKLAVFLNLFITAYNYAAEPFFFRRAGGNPSQADKQIYADAARGFLLVNCLAVAAILLLQPIAQRYLGEDLREGLGVLPILLAANLCLGLYYNFAVAYKLTDKTMLGGGIALVGTTIVIVGNVVFLPQIGIYAPAWSSLTCFLVMCVLAYWVSRRYFPVPYPIGRFGLLLAITTIFIYFGTQTASLWLRLGALFALSVVLLGVEWTWIKRALRPGAA